MGFGPAVGDLHVPSGVAPYSVAVKKTGNSQFTVQVKSSNGLSLDLSHPKNRVYGWVEGAAGANVTVEGGNVSVTGASGKATLVLQYQTARWNATEPWSNVTQTNRLGREWAAVRTTISL